MSYYGKDVSFESIVGMTFTSIEEYSGEILFTRDDGKQYKILHYQDCCETVYVESIVGDLEDLLNTPILKAEEAVSNDEGAYSGTWTFYKLATIKGYVDIRWHGESNGYYSESVDFVEVDE